MEKTAEAERKEELKKAKQEAAVKAAEEAKAALEPAKPVKEPDEIRFSRYGHTTLQSTMNANTVSKMFANHANGLMKKSN